MRRALILAFVALFCAAAAEAEPAEQMTLQYAGYLHGFPIMQVEIVATFSPHGYQVHLTYHTTGLFKLLYPGRETDYVSGQWTADGAAPTRYAASADWRGEQGRVLIDYTYGRPQVMQLWPPTTKTRDPVPATLQTGTKDWLSAVAQLLRKVQGVGTCDASARTYDGRRLSEIDARTAGTTTLAATSRSMFAGPALRCDFTGQMLAGFLRGQARPQPLHGTAWFGSALSGLPPIPVRMFFETGWLGDVTMYLTGAQVQAGTATGRGSIAAIQHARGDAN
jgi:hypothetical protein